MSRPNILHILVDQQRFDTIGALNNPIIRTPSLDKLVKNGVTFTNAYTPSPVCVAARCSMIYGQYPANTGCFENAPMPLDHGQTFMDALTKSGYRTHGIGKCHFTPDPLALRGFQTRDVQEELGTESVKNYPYMKYLQDKGYKHLCEPNGVRGEMYYIPQPSQLPPQDHPSQWIGDRSINFIKKNDDCKEPWYLLSSFIHPHPPFAPPNPWHKLYRPSLMPLPNIPDEYEALLTFVNKCQNRYKYRDNGFDKNMIRAMKAYYYACISFVDYQVGRILDELDRTGQTGNTMIIFTSDHGEHLGDYKCFGKRSMHDSCARIPLIVNQPGKFQGGVICEDAASLVDIAPTILGAAQAEISTHKIDGIDLYHLMKGDIKREYVFSQLSYNGMDFIELDEDFKKYVSDKDCKRAAFSTYMAANSDWKYFYSAPDNREFLFNKKTDPKETRNVVSNPFYKEALQSIKSSLINHLKECGETGGIEGSDWKVHKLPSFTKDPDKGLIIQDGYTPWVNTYIPGYSDC
ncbi:MAG: sulfatase family protein [Clostridium sp.]|uniref:sulfatase family protein n=1 Tax=Clostridium sp. TaxID=1506 RepID=UPI003D6CF7D7